VLELTEVIAREIKTKTTSRFAPGITGHLHLGHVVSALYVFGITKATGGEVLVRAEDHDQTRFRREFDDAIKDDLLWLGLIPDRSPWEGLGKVDDNLRQSNRGRAYQNYLDSLFARNFAYPCDCPRRRLATNTEGELTYDGHCRNRQTEVVREKGIRVVMPDQNFAFKDLIRGEMQQNPARQTGDILARDRHGCWTYQFACSADDLDQEVNLIIRGEDLLSSTGRQLALRQWLAPDAPKPLYFHHPLLKDQSGEKLGKRFLSESIASRRVSGHSPQELLGEAAFVAGKIAQYRPMEIAEALKLFSSLEESHGRA
jgi:glutamyl/glutaminyl-tRNA synthetase